LGNGGGGSLSAIASSTVRINELSGDLTVNQVKIAQSGDKVELKAHDNITGVSGNIVQGGLIILEAGGAVGSLVLFELARSSRLRRSAAGLYWYAVGERRR